MKKSIICLIVVFVVYACKNEKTTESKSNTEASTTEIVNESQEIEPLVEIKPITNDILETAIIYEANIRQYSPEGTFKAFTKDIPELKQLGVKVIWLMPVFPISETKRKATGGEFANLIKDEAERAKMLGSYYAVTDFAKINPEFGTINDFRALVNEAHKNGIYVILDWVPNHTGWDHIWLKNNPDYYTQNDQGEIVHPEETDWTDVADLNYDNKEMRKEMIADMSYWITEEGVDGFRCDVAGSVPTDFWKEAIPQLRAKKDIFMLAEAWEPELLKADLFDMAYGWDGHHLLNDMAKEEKSLIDWDKYATKVVADYEKDDILMNFVTNHDENSWNGTIQERMGDASELMTVFSYMIPGMPLIYSGQEYNLNHRLKFFEKDSIPKTKGSMWDVLKKLGTLKSTNAALNGGKESASYLIFETNNKHVLKYTRSKNGEKITFIGNFSSKPQAFKMTTTGTFLDYMANKEILFNNETVTLEPWAYKILTDL
ncbi:alpha-amylase family glycosyl hydrolase [Flavivirga amylovorans]|uniref:Alpha-amylase family glycosyl hydrolase n=1 Tax=Flavivirga amylovorans TaxID=870486 RepID=A0ABT8WXR8_9FLAO|nr:alpha-amylase family glycosyl hydrolase [Flavivirga amylovorans]MDO5986273.1 alpha-amylase family glycosyl hydrolase [Flavivirga amylovorans]